MPPGHIPVMQCVGPRRLARVRLSGHDVYLGRFGTIEAELEYDRVIAAWINNSRQMPLPDGPETVTQLADLYGAHALAYFQKNGRPTHTASTALRAFELLHSAGLGNIPPTDLTPPRLKHYRRFLVGAKDPKGRAILCRRTINEYVRHVVAMYQWAVEEQHVMPQVWHALQAVRPLRRGRGVDGVGVPREGASEVLPVEPGVLDATLASARPILADMIRLQLLTAMRPIELVHVRPCDVAPTVHPEVSAYTVQPCANKNDHQDLKRTVFFGPRAMEIVQRRTTAPDAYLFSPAVAREEHDAARRASRTLPPWPSHSPKARAARRKPSPAARRPKSRYTTDSYRRAIERACDAAFPHPTLSAVPEESLNEKQLRELEEWRKEHRWSPNQLRHNAATYIVEHESLDVARAILGHRSIETTLRYVKVHDDRAVAAMLKHG
jgi:integrase